MKKTTIVTVVFDVNQFSSIQNVSLDSTFMQNSTVSLPDRSHSIADVPTVNGHDHRHRSGLMHSNSATTNAFPYQRSLSYIDGNRHNFGPTIINDDLSSFDQYNIVNNHFIGIRLVFFQDKHGVLFLF